MLKKTMAFLLAFCLAPELLPPAEGGGAAYAMSLSEVEVLVVTAKREVDEATRLLRECRSGATNLVRMMVCNSFQESLLRAERELAMQQASLVHAELMAAACQAARDNAIASGTVVGALGTLVCRAGLPGAAICGAAVGAAAAACMGVED